MLHDLRQPNRDPPTLYQRINPLWWMGDVKRDAQWPQVWWLNWLLGVPGVRLACWTFRNPCANLFAVIIGISHRSRTVHYANGPGWTYSTFGWNWGYSVPHTGIVPRPFVSYRGRWIELAAGWKTSGAFTPMQLRIANSKQPGES
jgi:hypothetical protein